MSASITRSTPRERARSCARALPIIPDPITRAFIVESPLSFQYFPGFHAPEEEIQFIHGDLNVAGKYEEPFFDRLVSPGRETDWNAADHSEAYKVFQDVPVEYRQIPVSNISEEMGSLFPAQAGSVLDEPFPELAARTPVREMLRDNVVLPFDLEEAF